MRVLANGLAFVSLLYLTNGLQCWGPVSSKTCKPSSVRNPASCEQQNCTSTSEKCTRITVRNGSRRTTTLEGCKKSRWTGCNTERLKRSTRTKTKIIKPPKPRKRKKSKTTCYCKTDLCNSCAMASPCFAAIIVALTASLTSFNAVFK